MKGASKSSTSLTNFLGFTELPDWYITERYDFLDSRWIDNDFGHEIHYRDVGEGPVIVMLHGELSSLHTWNDWIDGLSEEYRIIAIDLPGSGLTGAPHCVKNNEKTCARNLTQDYIYHSFKYLVEDLKLSSFTLAGSSYGGYLAANYALEHPSKVDQLVLISPMGFQQPLPGILDHMTSGSTSLLSRFVQPASFISTAVEDFYGAPRKVTQANLARYIHLAQSDGAHHSNIRQLNLVRDLMERGSTFDLSEMKVPTMILWGGRDKWGDPSHAQLWNESIAESIVVNYSSLGHVPMEEDPETTLADFIAFMKGDDIPSILGLGTGDTFTIQDALDTFDKDSIFGGDSSSDEASDGEHEVDADSDSEEQTTDSEESAEQTEELETEMEDEP